MSSLKGKLEADVTIRAPPETVIRTFRTKTKELASICPDIVQACDLVEGEWGNLGSVTHLNYVVDGHEKSLKSIIQSVDSANNSISYRAIEGDLLDDFSSVTFKIEGGDGRKVNGDSLLHLTLSYVKRHEDVAPPEALLQQVVGVFQGLDSFLTH